MSEDPGKDSAKSLAENYDRQEANRILYYVTVLGEYRLTDTNSICLRPIGIERI